MSANTLISHRLPNRQVGGGKSSRKSQTAINSSLGFKVNATGAAKQRGSIQAGQLAQTHTLDDPLSAFINAGTQIFKGVGDTIEANHIADKQAASINDEFLIKNQKPLYEQALSQELAKLQPEEDTIEKRIALTHKLSKDYFKGVSEYNRDSLADSLKADTQLAFSQAQWQKTETERLTRGSSVLAFDAKDPEAFSSTVSKLTSGAAGYANSMNKQEVIKEAVKLWQANPRQFGVNSFLINDEDVPADIKERVRQSEADIKSYDSLNTLNALAKKGAVEQIDDLSEVALRDFGLTPVKLAAIREEAVKQREYKIEESTALNSFRATGKAPSNSKLTATQLKQAQNKAYAEADSKTKQRMIAQGVVPSIKEAIEFGLTAKTQDGSPDKLAILQSYKAFKQVGSIRDGLGFAKDYTSKETQFNELLLLDTLIDVHGESKGVDQYIGLKGQGLPSIKYSSGLAEEVNLSGSLANSPEVQAQAVQLLKTYSQLGVPEDKALSITEQLLNSSYQELEVSDGGYLGFAKRITVSNDVKPFLDDLESRLIGDETSGQALGRYLETLKDSLSFVDEDFDLDDFQIYQDLRNPRGIVVYAEGQPLIRITADAVAQ